jgi:hypothetical protein
MFMCIELMLNAVNLTFVAFSSFFRDVQGQLFVFIVMTVVAAEAAVGSDHHLHLRTRESLDVDDASTLKSEFCALYFDVKAVGRQVKVQSIQIGFVVNNNLLSLIIFAPLAGAAINWLAGRRVRNERFIGRSPVSWSVSQQLPPSSPFKSDGAALCNRS